jgi:molybdopterin/thiamine biosynthesis adenylyltransferase
MSTLSLIRSQGIFNPGDFAQDTGITLIGAGALGSHLFSTLVELGLQRIDVYDDDIVEPHNLNNQLFLHDDIGSPKVESVKRWAKRKLDSHIPDTMRFHNERVTAPEQCVGTVIFAVDTLAGRQNLFASCLDGNTDVDHLIDGRMAATHGVIYSINPHNHYADYLNTLGNDDDAEVSACGAPYSVSPTAKILANLMAWQLIHARQDNGASSQVTNVYLKPFMIATGTL